MRAEEFIRPHTMAKIAKSGRIVELLKHRDQVDFSNERGWFLINTEPGKRVVPDIKWIPDSTRFEWVKEFADLKEFATSPERDDHGPDEEEILRQYAAKWYNGDEDPRVEKLLATMGWEIGQNEDEDGGAFMLRQGDINGNSFISWTDEELSALDEGWKSALAGAAAAGAIALGGAGSADAKSAPATGPSVQQQAKMTPIEKLKTAARANGIKGTELAQFLAQCAHESANFTSMEERGTPAYFTKKYDPKYAPKTARILGNTEVGDGERYKGRGFIQLTGRDNYTRAGQALNLPLADNPQLAARPDVAAVVAVWYWKNRVASKVKNFHNTKQVTRAINPAGKGLQSRKDQFKTYQVAMR